MIHEGPLDRDRTVDAWPGRLEGGEEAVAGGVDDLPSPARNEPPEHVVVPAQKPLPGLVSEELGKVGGADDVGEHEGLPGGHRATPAVLGVPEVALGCLDVDPGAKPAELIERRAELEIGVFIVLDGSQGSRQDRPCSGDLVRRSDLAPALDRGAELPGRSRRVTLGHEHSTQGDLAARLQCRRRIPDDDPRELVDGGPRLLDVTGRDCDLHLGGEQARPSPAIPGLVGHGRVDRGGRSLDLALGEPDESERRLRRSTACVGLAQRRLGASEVALEPPDVADRVEPVGLWWRGVVGTQLGRRPLELLLGLLPGPSDRGHLGAVDPANAGEAGERLSVAVLLGRLDPLARPAIVGQVATRADHPAGGDPGGER